MKIGVAAAQYLEWKHITHPSAAKQYKANLLKFGESTRKEMEEVGIGDVVQYLNGLHIQNSTYLHFVVVSMRGFFQYWNDEGVCNVNPKKLVAPKYRFNPYTPVSREEYDLMCNFLDTEQQTFANIQKLLIIRFLFDTGVRVSELTDLLWREVDVSKQRVFIENKKNGHQRFIYWSDQTNFVLVNFLNQRKQFSGDYLFVTFEGKMSTRCVQRFLADLGKKLGISYPLSPHCFRHGRAHYMHKQGASVATIQAVLGHTNPASTHRYLQLSNEEVETEAHKYLTS